MLVEDDPASYAALRMLLTRRGWDVSVATTLREGQVLLETRPVCLILDLMLPDGDGSVILGEIRRRDLPTKVVVQTGVSDAAWLGRVKAMGPDLLLGKPIDFSALVGFLAQHEA